MGFREYAGSSIGMKTLMAITGLGLSFFVLAHMLGNWLVFAGQDALNSYAAAMHAKPALLWLARSGLIVIFVLHILIGIRLATLNRAARPISYSHPATVQASLESRTMIYTGLLILAFLLYHLAHFTLHVVNFTGPHIDPQGRPDVFKMVVTGFQNPIISGSYILAMVMLGFHLNHGFASLFQSLGLRREGCRKWLKCAGSAFAILVSVGNISMPVAILMGLIRLPEGGM